MNPSARLIALILIAAADVPAQASTLAGSADSATEGRGQIILAERDSRLDLATVVQRVLERNPTIAAARAAWSEAKAQARQTGALDNPMLDVMAAPRSFGSSNVDPAYRISVTQPLPIFGQRGLRHRIGEADARAVAWDLRTAQLDLVHEARTSYLDYWRVARAVALNRELLAVLPELRRVSLAKYAAGLTGQQDPLQIEVELAMLDHDSVILERERRVAAARLNVLMHQPADAWLPPPPDTLSVPDTSLVHADLAPRARALRPEMRAADARVESGRAGVDLASRERLPETSVSLAYDRFWSEPELRATVGVTLSLPIYPGPRSAARAEARARLDMSESRSEVVRDSIELQVADAAARLHEQAHDVRITRERLVPLAERTFKATRASYEANRADFVAVLNSLRVFLRARLEGDESLAMLLEARADLDRALGELPSELEKEKLP